MKPKSRNFLLALGTALLAATSAQAQTNYYWDSNTNTPGFGNTTGTWGTSAFWSTDSAGTGATANTTITNLDTVNFGTATLNYANAAVGVAAGGVTTNSIVFGAGQTTAITLGTVGNVITLGGSTPTITNNAAVTHTISSILSGSAGLIKAGSGTLALTGANDYTGGTTITGGILSVTATSKSPIENGTLSLSGGGRLSVLSTNITSSSQVSIGAGGGLISVAGNNNFTTTGILTGAGAFTQVDPGGSGGKVLNFNNLNNDFTGAININHSASGIIFSVNSLAASANNIAFNATGTNQSAAFALGSGAAAALTFGASGRAIEINSANATTGTIINNNNTHAITIAKDLIATGAGAKTLGLNAVTGATPPSNVFSGNITDGTGGGTVGITKTGAGNWSISGAANTFTGAISFNTITSGTNPAQSQNGGTLSYASAGGANAINFGMTTGSATLAYTGASAKTMSGAITASALTTGTITLTASGVTSADTINYSNTGSLGSAASGAKNLILDGSNTGLNTLAGAWVNNAGAAATLTKNGAGTWRLTGANTYTGNTTINGGVLDAIDGTSLPSGSGILQLRGGVFQSSGTFTRNVNATVGAGGVNWSTSSGGFAARGGTLNIQLNGGTSSLTWNGSSFVSTGQSLIFGSTSADSLVDFQNAINLGSSGSGQRTINVIDNVSSSTDRARISGAITNTAAGWGIIKEGNGILELTNTNTYSGDTTVNAGTLALGDGTGNIGNLGGTSSISVSTGAILSVNRTGATTQFTALNNKIISGGGSFVQAGSGTTTLSLVNTYTGATNVNAGTLLVNGSVSTSVLTTVASGATIGGTGTTGALTIQSGGFINPGNSPGILNVSGNYAQLGLYTAEIEGIVAGNGAGFHDQINVTGAVNITGGSLVTMFSGAGYNLGDLIFILLNDNSDAITGIYDGFAQGATVTSYDGLDWVISYNADSTSNTFTGSPNGNDIALMAVAIPEPSSALLLGSLGMLALLRRRRA